MVEEHSANLISRINSDYPNTIPAPLSSPSSQFDNLKLSNSSSEALDSFVTPLLSADKEKDTTSDLDVRTAIGELKKEGYRSSRPSSIESRRSKSLVNASSASVDSGRESIGKLMSVINLQALFLMRWSAVAAGSDISYHKSRSSFEKQNIRDISSAV